MDFPQTIWQGEALSLDFSFQDTVTSATFYATAVSSDSAAENQLFRFSKQFRRNANQWKLTYDVPANLAVGQWRYQIWTNEGRRKSCPFTAEFRVAPSLSNKVSDTGVFDTDFSTDTERQFNTVKEAIKNYIETGASSWSIAGNSTTKITLNQLYREHDRLFRLVNIERDERGLPPMADTPPDEINFF